MKPPEDGPALPLGEMLRRLWPFVRPDAWILVLAIAATPVIAAFNLAQPYLMKKAIDDHIVAGIFEGLPTTALWFLLASVGAYMLEALHALAVSWGGTRSILRMRHALYEKALGLSQSFFDRQPTGKLLTRLTTDLDSLGEAIAAGGVTILLDFLMIGGTLAAMVWLDAKMTLFLLLLAPPLLVVLEVLRRKMRLLFAAIRDAIASVNAFMAERVDGVEIVQLYNDHARAEEKFDRSNKLFRDLASQSNVYDALMFAVVDGVGSITIAAMLWYGSGLLSQAGLPVDTSAVTPGLLVAFIEYTDRLFRPLRDLSGKIAIIQRAGAALDKVFGLFAVGVAITPGSRALDSVRGALVLRDVRFRYRADMSPVLNGLDLEVHPGEVVAIVGATGSGKTTLTRLLDRSYDGYEGSITLDGVELRDLVVPTVRRSIASVRQDIQLFSETLRFNVDLANPRIEAARREEAARLVHADRTVQRLGWEHVLRERGADLSVGEGQLVTFARAMAHDPAIIILDEATASIDSVTEALVQDAIGAILSRKTVIVIAHRLSTVQKADRIAVMQQGRVVEVGNHQALMARDGLYASLVRTAEGLA